MPGSSGGGTGPCAGAPGCASLAHAGLGNSPAPDQQPAKLGDVRFGSGDIADRKGREYNEKEWSGLNGYPPVACISPCFEGDYLMLGISVLLVNTNDKDTLISAILTLSERVLASQEPEI